MSNLCDKHNDGETWGLVGVEAEVGFRTLARQSREGFLKEVNPELGLEGGMKVSQMKK